MKQILKNLLSRMGYSVQCLHQVPKPLLEMQNLRVLEFDDVVCRRMHEVGKELFFVQVGVYDGITHDPLRCHILESGWSGIMVEPQRRAAEGLKSLYCENSGIRIVNAAVDTAPQQRSLYTVEGPNAPDWAGGLASFDRATVAKHSQWCPGLEAMIKEESIQCLTFDQILTDIPDGRIDILQIDTEGADGFILSLFPFDKIRPAIVHYEIKHLDKRVQEEAIERLLSFGYRVARSGGEDMLAVL
jgi:hypothetical protein